jgi:hypothetical protein
VTTTFFLGMKRSGKAQMASAVGKSSVLELGVCSFLLHLLICRVYRRDWDGGLYCCRAFGVFLKLPGDFCEAIG